MPQFVVTSDQILAYIFGAVLVTVLFGVIGFIFKKARAPFYGMAKAGVETAMVLGIFWVVALWITT